jgi:hypothetical protein
VHGNPVLKKLCATDNILNILSKKEMDSNSREGLTIGQSVELQKVKTLITGLPI